HDDQSGPETRRRELDAAHLRRGDNIAGNADDKKVTQALVEHDLCRDARIGAPENNGKRGLRLREFNALQSFGARRAAVDSREEAAIAFLKTFECFSCRYHEFGISMSCVIDPVRAGYRTN